MKVYFDATPRHIAEYKRNYQLIGETIERLGHELTSRWILDFEESFFSMPRKLWKEHYKKIMTSAEKADVVVVDSSVSSTSIGQIIQQALIWKKPVVVLKDHSERPNQFLEGAGEVESKLLVVEYTIENLEEKLKEALEYVEEWLETRFTMILDGETRRLLDQATKNGESRSEYLRRLIHEDKSGEGK